MKVAKSSRRRMHTKVAQKSFRKCIGIGRKHAVPARKLHCWLSHEVAHLLLQAQDVNTREGIWPSITK